MMKEKVGFIGLGIMGHAMAINIARAGYPLKVYNRTRKDSEALKALGVFAVCTRWQTMATSHLLHGGVYGSD